MGGDGNAGIDGIVLDWMSPELLIFGRSVGRFTPLLLGDWYNQYQMIA
jgi:hypothetical protein